MVRHNSPFYYLSSTSASLASTFGGLPLGRYTLCRVPLLHFGRIFHGISEFVSRFMFVLIIHTFD